MMANMVAGLDGSTSIDGRVGALSSRADAALLKLLRSLSDVVLVGAETLRRERYGPVRLPEERRQARIAAGKPAVPHLAVVSRSLDLDWGSPAFVEAEPESPTMVVTAAIADPARLAEARAAAEVVVAGDAGVDLGVALKHLAARGAAVVLCEGGPSVLGQLVSADLLDELCLTLSPMMGGDPLPVAVAPEPSALARFALGHSAVEDSTLFLRYQRADPS
ncbi:MAG: pyrimidine reductase family protein [Acidimicrobiia bacterium]|nr:pyrimidine reductase family protein [Acidimicrobiia bacterium]